MENTPYLAIVTPVYNDWDTLAQLVHDIDRVASELGRPVRIFAVNDGSTVENLPQAFDVSEHVLGVEVIHLIRNLGHQRAVAIGLVAMRDEVDAEAVIVMDADGEDRPADIARLYDAHRAHPNRIVVARRRRRSEGSVFRSLYFVYKRLTSLLLGFHIDFGNFCLIPRDRLDDLTHNPSLWNHLAATISRSKIPLTKVETDRGPRYAGESKMNLESLILHGLSAMSVHLDVIVVRVLIYSSIITLLAVIGILAVLFILLFTDLAIPGWATSAVGILVIIIFQTLLFSSSAAFVVLNIRTRVLIIPALDTLKLIKKRETIFERVRADDRMS